MKYLLSADEMKKYDQSTIEKIGIPAGVLMERAALAVRDYILNLHLQEKTAFVLVGYGNNGADGLALARLLSDRGFEVEVCAVGNAEHRTALWDIQRNVLEFYEIPFVEKPNAGSYGVIVDSLFGIGLSREVSGDYQKHIEMINGLKGYKCALDIPSGIHATNGEVLGNAFRADVTITFGFLKRGLLLYPGCEYAGNVVLADIGINEKAFLGVEPELFFLDEKPAELLPKRLESGNKGSFGKVLMVCGSLNMAGAAILSAKACYRVGAGMVKIITCPENRVIVQETLPDAMLGTYEDLQDGMNWADVLVIGPGIAQSENALQALKAVICECKKPLLIDADGINLLAQNRELVDVLRKQGIEGRSIVLTPHAMELMRMLKACELCSESESDDSNGIRDFSMEDLKKEYFFYGKKLASFLHGVVVAKDARSFVCKESGPCMVNVCGNCGMAVAGSGDVLAGMIGGLMAQKMSTFESACTGVYFHALAGDEAAKELGEHGLMASDLIDYIWKVGKKDF